MAGASPAMARYLRERLDAYLEVELGDVARILYDVRLEILAAEEESEGRPWSAAITDELFALVREGRTDEAREYVRSRVAT